MIVNKVYEDISSIIPATLAKNTEVFSDVYTSLSQYAGEAYAYIPNIAKIGSASDGNLVITPYFSSDGNTWLAGTADTIARGASGAGSAFARITNAPYFKFGIKSTATGGLQTAHRIILYVNSERTDSAYRRTIAQTTFTSGSTIVGTELEASNDKFFEKVCISATVASGTVTDLDYDLYSSQDAVTWFKVNSDANITTFPYTKEIEQTGLMRYIKFLPTSLTAEQDVDLVAEEIELEITSDASASGNVGVSIRGAADVVIPVVATHEVITFTMATGATSSGTFDFILDSTTTGTVTVTGTDADDTPEEIVILMAAACPVGWTATSSTTQAIFTRTAFGATTGAPSLPANTVGVTLSGSNPGSVAGTLTTAEDLAAAIQAKTFTGWTQTVDGAIVTFTADVGGVKTGTNSISPAATGVTGTFDITVPGANEATEVATINVLIAAY